ncbi:MAG: hypothetical protein K8R21_04580 [Leptospira sp.]|nr:hypothetical protein [Leptospira sp.]
MECLFQHYFPGRKIELPRLDSDDDPWCYEKRDDYIFTIAAEVEFIQHVEKMTMARAIVKAFNGD